MTNEAETGGQDLVETKHHLIVGLGASAGGLEALEEFFDNVPADTGMAYVVITHQAPGRVSLMPELLRRHSRVPVVEVSRPTAIEPDTLYLTHAGVNLGILDGVLTPIEIADSPVHNLPIDFFFRSLAQDQKQFAVGIVLSGTGSDGTLGLKEIKGASGLTMAQDEATARYPGMPHSAIAGTQVDFVVAPAEMAAQLVAYGKRVTGQQLAPRAEVEQSAPEDLHRVLLLLRSRTGCDFSIYKMTTIRRRVERRMNMHQIETMRDYLRFVQSDTLELDRLFKELLIGVTSFFRDADAFEALSKALPAVLRDRSDETPVRVWVAGCSTGEEAYSIAILLNEAMESIGRRFSVQIFATDLDPEAIEAARAGIFPESIAADVDAKRLERFFTRDGALLRVKKEVRELIVFAEQNVIADPPFTKLDLLSCRNLLIYLESRVQQRLVPMFHYALRPGGLLFLGTSESIGTFSNLFEPVDKKWKIFSRQDVPTTEYVVGMQSLPRDAGARGAPTPLLGRKPAETGHVVAERVLLQHLVPPAVVMHERGEIVHIHGRTGMFLEPPPGPAAPPNVYNMAREGLQLELAVAVRHAATTDGEVVHRNVRVKTNGDTTFVNLRVRKLRAPEAVRNLFLVAFEVPEQPEATTEAVTNVDSDLGHRVVELERELKHSRELNQSTIEELETANEEMKSTNEELQSTNEELQSTNEELETSKEEMQSLNEELQTVNSELQGKVEQLSRINDDMKNLLNATEIATLFLDNELNIKRYTEQTKRVIRLIASDVGRKISDLVPKLRYDRLVEDASEVLRTLARKEVELKSEDGRAWFLMRILPYRTTDNVIDGLVVTFVDITKIKEFEAQTLRMTNALHRSPASVFGQDRDLRYEWAIGPVFGLQPVDVLGKRDRDVLSDDNAKAIVALKQRVLTNGETARTRLRMAEGGKEYQVYLEPMRDVDGEIVGVSGSVMELAELE